MLLAGWAAPAGDPSAAGSVFGLISRIDGAKMLLLAVLALSGMELARRARTGRAWARFPSIVLAAVLTGSGLGYLLLSPALAALAYLSLPLLLIWVAGAGLWLARSADRGPDRAAGMPPSSAASPGDPDTKDAGPLCLPRPAVSLVVHAIPVHNGKDAGHDGR